MGIANSSDLRTVQELCATPEDHLADITATFRRLEPNDDVPGGVEAVQLTVKVGGLSLVLGLDASEFVSLIRAGLGGPPATVSGFVTMWGLDGLMSQKHFVDRFYDREAGRANITPATLNARQVRLSRRDAAGTPTKQSE